MVISLAQAYTLEKVLKRVVMRHSITETLTPENLTLNADYALTKVIHLLKLMRIELAFTIG